MLGVSLSYLVPKSGKRVSTEASARHLSRILASVLLKPDAEDFTPGLGWYEDEYEYRRRIPQTTVLYDGSADSLFALRLGTYVQPKPLD